MPPPLPSPQTTQPQPPVFTEQDSRPLHSGESGYVSNIMVFPQNDMVTHTIHECDACNGVALRSMDCLPSFPAIVERMPSAIPERQFPTGRKSERKVGQDVPSITTFIRI